MQDTVIAYFKVLSWYLYETNENHITALIEQVLTQLRFEPSTSQMWGYSTTATPTFLVEYYTV